METLKPIQDQLGLTTLDPMPFDVSTRRYFRAPQGVLMIDQDEGNALRIANFCDIAHRLQNAGLRAPEIYTSDPEAGFIYMEDFGGKALKDLPSQTHYTQALKNLEKLPQIDPSGLKLYSQDVYVEELSRLIRFYLRPLGIDDEELLALAQDEIEELAAQSHCFVHLDYHAENIMVLEDGQLGLIDFQDARQGHRLYDLASFLDDVRTPFPDKIRFEVLQTLSSAEARSFAILSTQRLIKIIGIFARMAGEGREKYAALLPVVFDGLEQSMQDPSLKIWREWFLDVVPHPTPKNLAKLQEVHNDR